MRLVLARNALVCRYYSVTALSMPKFLIETLYSALEVTLVFTALDKLTTLHYIAMCYQH